MLIDTEEKQHVLAQCNEIMISKGLALMDTVRGCSFTKLIQSCRSKRSSDDCRKDNTQEESLNGKVVNEKELS